jgi:hypothetical protein
MYSMLNNMAYYYAALKNWEEQIDLIPPDLQDRILKELVDSVLLDGKPNPANLIKNWSSVIGKDEGEFVNQLIENTEILEGLSVFGGTGLLPDIWPLISDDKVQFQILDILSKNCEGLDNASFQEKKLFLEDMYLIEDDLLDVIGDEEKWDIIIETLDEFHPDIPPKNFLQQAQMQAAEQNKMMRASQVEEVQSEDNEPSSIN